MGFLRRGVMSLKEMPGFGKSGTSRIYCLSFIIPPIVGSIPTVVNLVVDVMNRGYQKRRFRLRWLYLGAVYYV